MSSVEKVVLEVGHFNEINCNRFRNDSKSPDDKIDYFEIVIASSKESISQFCQEKVCQWLLVITANCNLFVQKLHTSKCQMTGQSN